MKRIFLEFETSRLEMGAVADLFDRHGEGLIDWKEFIAALRPDWEERRTYNDTDKIHDEVKRLVMLCTCRQKFRVFQVGEGKYRVPEISISKKVSIRKFYFIRLIEIIVCFAVRRQSEAEIGSNSAIHRDGSRRWWMGSLRRISIKE